MSAEFVPIRDTHPDADPPADGGSPLVVRRPEAARLCGVAPATWDRLAAAGKTPKPIKLGGSILWNRRELAAWVNSGCPNRLTWEPLWAMILASREKSKSGRAGAVRE